jgi:hypothetical protein
MTSACYSRCTESISSFVWLALVCVGQALLPLPAYAQALDPAVDGTQIPAQKLTPGAISRINDWFTTQTFRATDGTTLGRATISSPPSPPYGYEIQRLPAALPDAYEADAGVKVLTAPAFSWYFGCSATSAAMIAGFYDRNGFPNIYTGPTNGGVIPLDNSFWPNWSDSYDTYSQCPLTASRAGLDGRAAPGSIDDYWVSYGTTSADPYITYDWSQHAWGDAVGDYMKTSQSAYGNTDGATSFYYQQSSPAQLTCAQMESFGIQNSDGTYGRKLFYEARGYQVTDCYYQNTDNIVSGGFSYAQYEAEIDAGHPVMLNLQGHTIVGVGYDDVGSVVYIHDTWDNATHTMTWGGSYAGMPLQGVSIVNLQVLTSLFGDVQANDWATPYISAILSHGLTKGCSGNPPLFCPIQAVTRDEMAAFIIRALDGESFSYSATPYFADVPANDWAFKYVQKLYESSITNGCGGGDYCPGSTVPRDQMAVFLVRALLGDSFTYDTSPVFADVPASHWAFKYIQKLYELGITTGCGGNNYCPSQAVTREEMAAFLARAFLGTM